MIGEETSETGVSYRVTAIACYIGNFVQAIVINLTPILFIPLKERFGFSFEQLGFLVLVNFITQVACDLAFSGAVDRYGYRPFAVWAHFLTIVGFTVFAFSAILLREPYWGLVLGTIIFSGSGGLLELLLSPIVNAIPTEEKATAMSILHSFYAWGQVAVVLATTILIRFLGAGSWPWIMMGWTLVPALNLVLFTRVPLAPGVPEEHRQGMRQLILNPFFVTAFMAIMLGGASEVSMNQWTSTFMEKALRLPKVVGDAGGMSMFAVMLGLGRLLYGRYGGKVDVSGILVYGSLLAAVCYLVIAFSTVSMVSLIACALCGFAVSLLWPGTLVVAAERFPLAGAWLFAILAAGGDIGASFGPWLVGVITEEGPKFTALATFGHRLGFDGEQLGLRLGMFGAVIFPMGAYACHRMIRRNRGISGL